jgi:hypothetical protein
MALKSDPCVEAEADTRTQGTLAHAEGTGPRRADRGSAILSGPILATMLKLGLPTIVVLIVQTFVGIAERYFVSFLGTDALASVARWLVVAAIGGGLGALFATVAIATSAFAVSRQPHSASPAGNRLKPARRVRKQSKVLRDRPRWDREEQPMRSEALFGISVLLCFVALGIVTALYIWPRLETMSREDALTALVVPHTFRFIGLSFLIPGVVSPSLPPAFAAPTAYGDLGATLLAIAATGALATRAAFALPLVWALNLWGSVDLVAAIYQGQLGVHIGPGTLGSAFYIPTVIVPQLLITHGPA